jgi:hypothetical protein
MRPLEDLPPLLRELRLLFRLVRSFVAQSS